MINNGASLSQVQVAIHQNDPRMAARYAHLFSENRDVVDRIDNEGTAGILSRVGEAEGNSTTRLLPKGKKFSIKMTPTVRETLIKGHQVSQTY